MNETVRVVLWGTTVGHLGYAPGQNSVATFEYDELFSRSGVQISPVTMAHPPRRHRFDSISFSTFKGLPGICADSLPDTFGNRLLDLYFAEQEIPAEQITALDRLLSVGNRGMGALEYRSAGEFSELPERETALNIRVLAELAEIVTAGKNNDRKKLLNTLNAVNAAEALQLIRAGSSAGGARSKALVARSGDGNFFDGTAERDSSFSHWLLKFDSSANSDRDGADPKGLPRVEYIYSLIARECGIDIPDTDYLCDGDDFHFLIRRFDRLPQGTKTVKLHYASWAALAHADRDSTGAYSYEQLALLARQLDLGQNAVTELFRRAVFNVIGRNQDDHTKNFGFLMDKTGAWRLAPAFDLTYAFDPAGRWTRAHQIKLSGLQDGFTREDLLRFGKFCNLDARKAGRVIDSVLEAFRQFENLAVRWELSDTLRDTIKSALRRDL